MVGRLTAHWNNHRKHNQHIRDAGEIEVRRVMTKLQVVAPFDARFPPLARSIGGKWRHRSQIWSIPSANEAQLLQFLRDIFDVIITVSGD